MMTIATFFLCLSLVSRAEEPLRSAINKINIQEILSNQQAIQHLANQLYARECRSDPTYLIHWNDGEDFASLGIGHFIWYLPEDDYEQVPVFEEAFPAMFDYVSKFTPPPLWLSELRQKTEFNLPWQSKKTLLEAKETKHYQSLRNWLLTTKHKQAEFVVLRFMNNLNKKLEFHGNREGLMKKYHALVKDRRSLFALLDYAHFKGIGFNSKEQYQQQGWGVIDVLSRMQPPYQLDSFKKSAKSILQQRVKNAPKIRNEQRWLTGWFRRIDQY